MEPLKKSGTTEIRLNRFLAEAGVASRRDADELIKQRVVTVNGQIAETAGQTLDPKKDAVKVAGKRVFLQPLTYILLNKPEGVISSADDPENRPTVISLLRGVKARVYPVGRLDYNTSGVMLLTNDGDLALRLTHPRYGFDKTYLVRVSGLPTPAALKKMAQGVRIAVWSGFEKTLPAKVAMVGHHKKGALLEITLKEGKQHQVKKMCEAIHHPVMQLTRIKFGFLTAHGLRPGQWRYLTAKEIERLQQFKPQTI